MRARFALSIFAALILAAVPATASTFLAMSWNELVNQADAVVQGRVVELESSWSESGRIIKTEALIEVDEALLGSTAGSVKVRTYGGQVGDVIVEAHGFPRFERGERVILFLTTNPHDGSIRVLGYQQGHFRLVTRLDGVTLAVPMVDEGAFFLTRSGRIVPPIESVPVDHFKAALQAQAMSLGRADQ